jgi:hypothetical protein
MATKRTHQQFLDELIIKNEQYRNGEFSVDVSYTGVDNKIFILN